MDSPGIMRNSAFPFPFFMPSFPSSVVPVAFNLFRDGPSPWPSSRPFLFRSAHSCRTFAAFSTRATLFGMPSSSIAFRAPGARLTPLSYQLSQTKERSDFSARMFESQRRAYIRFRPIPVTHRAFCAFVRHFKRVYAGS